MIDALSFLLEILSVVLILYSLYGKKIKVDIYNLLLITSEVICITIINNLNLERIVTISVYILIIIFCIFEFGFEIKRIFINNVLNIVILLALQLIGDIIYLLIFDDTYVFEALFVNGLAFLCAILIYKFLKVDKISGYLLKKEKFTMSIIFFLAGVTLFYVIYFKTQKSLSPTVLFVIILVLLVYIILGEWKKNKIQADELKRELEVERLYAKSFESLISNIRQKQHEFNNHINALHSMQLIYNEYDELVEAQNEYCKDINYNSKFIHVLKVGDPTLAGFLYSRFVDVEQKGITVNYNLNYYSINANIPMYIIIEIIGNLINNAIEELEHDINKEKILQLSIIEEKKIILEVYNVSSYIPIERSKSFFEKGYSTKGNDRGLGLYSIKQICKKYNIGVMCNNKIIDAKNYFGFCLLFPDKD